MEGLKSRGTTREARGGLADLRPTEAVTSEVKPSTDRPRLPARLRLDPGFSHGQLSASVGSLSPPASTAPFLYFAGCHLCEGASEKITACLSAAAWDPSLPNLARSTLEVRDIASRPDWAAAYDLEVPVLRRAGRLGDREATLPRPQPRATARQIGVKLEAHLDALIAAEGE